MQSKEEVREFVDVTWHVLHVVPSKIEFFPAPADPAARWSNRSEFLANPLGGIIASRIDRCQHPVHESPHRANPDAMHQSAVLCLLAPSFREGVAHCVPVQVES